MITLPLFLWYVFRGALYQLRIANKPICLSILPGTFIATFPQNDAMNKCHGFGTGKSDCPSLAYFLFVIGITERCPHYRLNIMECKRGSFCCGLK